MNYLMDKRVQKFLQIEDPNIIQKIFMMSFQQQQPTSKIYTTLNIIDEYQKNREDELDLDEDKTDVSMLITESAKLSFISQENALCDAYDGFSIKVMDHGINTTKFDLSYKAYTWILSKNQELVDWYLESIGIKLLSDLNV